MDQYWLSDSKALLLAFKVRNAPNYLQNLMSNKSHSSHNLRSSSTVYFVLVPCTPTGLEGHRGYVASVALVLAQSFPKTFYRFPNGSVLCKMKMVLPSQRWNSRPAPHLYAVRPTSTHSQHTYITWNNLHVPLNTVRHHLLNPSKPF